MVKLNKIYTRTGDDGQTVLVNGLRVAKHAKRPVAFGEVDELNSVMLEELSVRLPLLLLKSR